MLFDFGLPVKIPRTRQLVVLLGIRPVWVTLGSFPGQDAKRSYLDYLWELSGPGSFPVCITCGNSPGQDNQLLYLDYL